MPTGEPAWWSGRLRTGLCILVEAVPPSSRKWVPGNILWSETSAMKLYRTCMPEHQIFVRIPRAGVQLFWCWKVLRMHNHTKQPRMREEGPFNSGAPRMTVVRGPLEPVDTDSDASSDTIPSESSTECPHRESDGEDSESSTDVVAGPAIPTASGSGGRASSGGHLLYRGAGGGAGLDG